jgi:hypothetical protein
MIPAGSQRVTVRLPSGARAQKIQLLTAGTTPRVETTGSTLVVTVPSVECHEVIAIDL